jgi:RTX calcium-binding nonapeptide repeat (4 copies)
MRVSLLRCKLRPLHARGGALLHSVSERGKQMRKTGLFMASTALAVLVVCGVALADDILCPNRAANLCVGTTGDDTLTGTANSDTIQGRDGNDLIKGRAGKDQLAGELGNDEIRGHSGADDIFGNRGNETIDAGGSPQPGIIGGSGPDGLNGGGGDDFIMAANDGSSDNISCGASSGQGGDIVAFDRDNAGITDVLDATCDDAQQVPIGEG